MLEYSIFLPKKQAGPKGGPHRFSFDCQRNIFFLLGLVIPENVCYDKTIIR